MIHKAKRIIHASFIFSIITKKYVLLLYLRCVPVLVMSLCLSIIIILIIPPFLSNRADFIPQWWAGGEKEKNIINIAFYFLNWFLIKH